MIVAVLILFKTLATTPLIFLTYKDLVKDKRLTRCLTPILRDAGKCTH